MNVSNVAFKMAAIYLIGFGVVRVVKVLDVEMEHAYSVGTMHTQCQI